MIHFFTKKEKEKVENTLKEQFGINEIPGELVKIGQERIFLYTGSLTQQDIAELEKVCFIERTGVYFAKEEFGETRLSIEGSQIIKDQIKKNIFEMSDEVTEEWMKGHELLIQSGKKTFLAMKHGDDFLGTGKASENKISNFIPKNRRLKEKQN